MFDSIAQKIWTGIKLCFGVLLVLFGGLVILGLLTGEAKEIFDQFTHLEGEGLTAKAKILDIERREIKTTRRGDAFRHALGTESYDYYVEFEFKPANGPAIKDRRRILAGNPASLKVGGLTEILYHPQDPKVNRLTRYSEPYRPHNPTSTLALWTGIFLLGVFTIWWNWPRRASAATNLEGRMPRVVAVAGESPTPEPRQQRHVPSAPVARRPVPARTVRTTQGFGARNRA